MTKDFIDAVKRYVEAVAGYDRTVLYKDIQEAEAHLDSFGAEEKKEDFDISAEEKDKEKS